MIEQFKFQREFNSNFVGRKTELDWLDNRLFKREYSSNSIIVSGVGGVGKTSLIKHWFASKRLNSAPIWVDLGSEGENFSLDHFGNYLSNINQENFPYGSRLIIVIDGTDNWTEEEHLVASGKIFNYKMVSSLIFIRRKQLKLERFEQLVVEPFSDKSSSDLLKRLLSNEIGQDKLFEAAAAAQGYPLAVTLLSQLMNGGNLDSIPTLLQAPIYELSNNILVPKTELITSVSPLIVSANNSLITTLQKQPSDLRNLTPREFEKLLAMLLTDMGWEVELTKQTRDGGADILAYLNTEVGRLLCLVEAKHYREDRKIGVDLVRTLYGTLCDAEANSAMLVTSSSFTKDAREFQQRHEYQLSLRDYADVVTWILKFGNKQNNFA